jgi:hypothetical protein
MMDGSSRMGHMYNSVIYCHPRQWIVQFDNRQLYPVDTGKITRVTVASLATRSWLTSLNEEAGVPPYESSDSSDAGCIWSNPANGDFYALRETRMIRYDANAADPTNAWSVLFNASSGATASSENGCAAMKWTDNISLVYARSPASTNIFWLYDHNTNVRTILTMAGSAAARFTSIALSGQAKQYGLLWNPDLGKWMLGSPIWDEDPAYTGGPNCNVWTVDVVGTVATVEPLLTTTPMFTPGIFVGQGKTGGVRNGWAYHPNLGGVVICQEDNRPLRFLRTRTPSSNKTAVLFGADGAGPSGIGSGYTRSLCMTAEAPFTHIQLMAVNWSSATQQIGGAIVATSTRVDQAGTAAGGTITPNQPWVAVTWDGGSSTTSVAPAVDATLKKPTIKVSDLIPLTSSARVDISGARPLAYIRTYEPSGATTNGPIPTFGWTSAIGASSNRMLSMVRAQNTGVNNATVATASTFVSGGPTDSWIVPIFHHGVKAKTIMYAGDSTFKGTNSTNNGDGTWCSLATRDASTQSRPLAQFILGFGGSGPAFYLEVPKAFIGQGFKPDVCVFEVLSSNSIPSDVTAAWASVIAFKDYLIAQGIVPVLVVPFPMNGLSGTGTTTWNTMVNNTIAYGAAGGYIINATTGILQANAGSPTFAPGYSPDGIHLGPAGNTAVALVAQTTLSVVAAL